MAVSAKKTTKRRKRNRRSHHALKSMAFVYCLGCNNPVKNHNECSECGLYGQPKVAG
jgi:large subunit ribosomal protein L32